MGHNSFLASADLRCLLSTFANSWDPGQACQNACPDLDPKFWYSDGVRSGIFLNKF